MWKAGLFHYRNGINNNKICSKFETSKIPLTQGSAHHFIVKMFKMVCIGIRKIGRVGFFFFKYFWRTHTHVLFWRHLYPCFGFKVMFPLGFKARVGCLICFAEANVMYVPWDPPLVLHIADLLMVSIAGHRLGSYLAQGYYWHQWGSNPRSRDHEFYALTTRPRVPVFRVGIFINKGQHACLLNLEVDQCRLRKTQN